MNMNILQSSLHQKERERRDKEMEKELIEEEERIRQAELKFQAEMENRKKELLERKRKKIESDDKDIQVKRRLYEKIQTERNIRNKYEEIYTKAHQEDCDDELIDEDDKDFIDFNWFQETVRKQEQLCANCAEKMTFESGEWKTDIMTIERKDSLLGHTKDNCILICNGCNINNSGFFEPQSSVCSNNTFSILINKPPECYV